MRIVLTMLLVIPVIILRGQFGSECFDAAKEQMQKDIQAYSERPDTDTVYFLPIRLNMVIGCKYPYWPL